MGVGTIVRRTFLVGSAAVAGGVASGVYAVDRPLGNPLLDDLREGEVAFNPFVKVDANAITLITPRAEKGQGDYSIQAYFDGRRVGRRPSRRSAQPWAAGSSLLKRRGDGGRVAFPRV